MSEVVRVSLPSGKAINARVRVEGPTDVGARDLLKKLDIENFRETIEGVAESVSFALERVKPDEVSVEFGLELEVRTGKLTSVLAEGSGKASIAVTLTWRGAEGQPISVGPAPA